MNDNDNACITPLKPLILNQIQQWALSQNLTATYEMDEDICLNIDFKLESCPNLNKQLSNALRYACYTGFSARYKYETERDILGSNCENIPDIMKESPMSEEWPFFSGKQCIFCLFM